MGAAVGSELVVHAAERREWSSVSGLSGYQGAKGVNTLLAPRDRNEAGLDTLFWDGKAGHHWPLNCTVAETHGLHAQGLADAVVDVGLDNTRHLCAGRYFSP